MKFSNFILTKTKGTNPFDWEYFATVTVTTGYLWWRRVVTREIRRVYGGWWHFTDTGKMTPGDQVCDLARAWSAQTGQPT